ncbi:MAG TPA: histidine phosphatase family protein [Herpetosiphonaceae bacterium]
MYLYLIRHAQPHYSAPGPYHLPPGPGLTDDGIVQAARLGPMLSRSGIERVVSSPLRRCVMTAETLAAALQLDVVIDGDLREGQPEEATADVTVRMLRAALAQADARVVALVSHNAPLVYLLQALTHDDVRLPPKDRRGNQLAECMVWSVYNRGGRWRAQHLPPEGTRC